MSDSKLIAESPRLILPSLAVAVGLNEAIVLQQIHFLTCNGGGEPKVSDLVLTFPFWSPRTIERTLHALATEDLVEVGSSRRERSRWYRVGYAELGRRVNVTVNLSDKLSRSQRQPVVVPLLNAVERKGKREDAPTPGEKYGNVARRPGS